jgi:lipoprotein-releasing system permease protein
MRSVFTAVHPRDTSNTLIRFFVALSLAFGIEAVLVVPVIRRSKDIGIRRAIGASRAQIQRIFLIQGAVLAFIGSIIGSVMDASARTYFRAIILQADGSELFRLVIDRSLFFWNSALATLTDLVAATAPALRAASLNPVEAIRG